MKIIISIFVLSIFGMIASCQQKDLDAGKPTIKAISFAGIPAQNVQIDQRTRTIIVKVPSVLPDAGLVPRLELSKNASVKEGLTPSGKIILTPYCRCIPSGAPKQEAKLLISQNTTGPDYPPTTTYRVVLSPPAGCLEPIADKPITFSNPPDIDDPNFIRIHLPVKNLYQNPYIRAYFFKNLDTGIEQSLYTSVAGFCLNTCEDESANRLTFPYNNNPAYKRYLPPGKYQVSILANCDKNRITFPQPFILTE